MKLLRILAAASAAALLPVGLAVPAAHAEPVYDTRGPAVTVYNTPGGQKVGGRLWNTTCAMYSKTVVRCTTNIWATQIVYEAGRFREKTGWHFNNLTYLPSTRSAWAGNPLAQKGEFTSGGRKWMTECDTPKTGKGGCRSYLWTQYIQGSAGRYKNVEGWVFNNQVQFATRTLKPVTAVPAHVLDRAVLTPTGYGPIQIGTNYQELGLLGYGALKDYGDSCVYPELADVVTKRGIDRYYPHEAGSLAPAASRVTDLKADNNIPKTARGAAVGMTVAEVKRLYGSALVAAQKAGSGGDVVHGFSVREGANELFFMTEDTTVPTPDSLSDRHDLRRPDGHALRRLLADLSQPTRHHPRHLAAVEVGLDDRRHLGRM